MGSDFKEQLEAMYRDRISELENQLEEKNIERDQFEAELKEKLEVKDREKEEMEATLCRQIKEMEHVEAALRGEIEDLRSGLLRTESSKKILEVSLFGQITLLQKKLQEKTAYVELLETTLIDKFKEVRNVTEAHGGKICEVNEHSESVEKTYSEKYNAESVLRGQREDYERRLRKRDAKFIEVRDSLNGVINRLQNKLEESEKTKLLRKKLRVKNAYIELLETTLIDKFKEVRNLTEAHGGKLREVNEHSEKVEKTYSEKYEAESVLRGQREDYEGRFQERDAKCIEVRDTLNGVINRLQKQLEESERAKTVLESLLHTKTRLLAATMSVNRCLLSRQ